MPAPHVTNTSVSTIFCVVDTEYSDDMILALPDLVKYSPQAGAEYAVNSIAILLSALSEHYTVAHLRVRVSSRPTTRQW
jgi:hypothetical protein